VPEIGTPGLMSGDGKRGVGHRPQATAPILDSTEVETTTSSESCQFSQTFGAICSVFSKVELRGRIFETFPDA
jgi:hypothetical protein